MRDVLYNYSSLQKRETKIYAIGGTGIPGGLSVNFIKIVGPVALAFIILGAILSAIFGINMFNPFGEKWNWAWLIAWAAAGLIIGFSLWNIQFSGYRLYQYLIAYLKPKKVYTNDFNIRNREFKFTNIKIKSIIKQII